MLTERHWWAILVEAEVAAEDGQLGAQELAAMARVKLRDEFGINLDEVWIEADREGERLLAELRAKIARSLVTQIAVDGVPTYKRETKE